ncbi:TPA: hypothetical protein I7142_23385 [Vibrio vulnificus]|uniref:hypothetical protein n=1 Tax=Vibrio vulnificus TaxID=672 RepID=UPI001A2B901A|nr:hypothetical protein [Vibrio vulnificus]HAS6036762.1 hypothetical protein [Vibrio vulnificus]HAS6410237.1 hypothetical protein [Vibrio vulnificus]HDY7488719.1 hypothetical protein [Vibrio vulnificus]HDY7951608.1 hypothetical protein [Vibrio vulnificus]
MRYIRCKQEQFDIVLAEDGGVIGNAQFGNTVAALDKSGQLYRLPFRGFLPVETHSHLRRVKIIDITQFSFHQRHYCWNDVPPNHYVVGV